MITERKWIPTFLKPVIRFIYYPQERARVFRESKIRKLQDDKIHQRNSSGKKHIIFLVEGADFDTGTERISGGIISIVSLCQESEKLKSIHGAEVLLCTFPKQRLLMKHTQFKNDVDVFRFDQLKNYFTATSEILVHVPEYLCAHFISLHIQDELSWLKKMNLLHINILNQNIQLMPSVDDVKLLKNYATTLTITTAHQQYCTLLYRQLYTVPLHKFSVWISPEKYEHKTYTQKQNLMIVSPDGHPSKAAILAKLARIPGLRLQVIQNLTYEKYKETISDAKWALTFGEGLDGYLIESIFSGAIGFTVYNEEFFTPDFKFLTTIYQSSEELSTKIVETILQLDNHDYFCDYQKMQFRLCAKYYSQMEYQANIVAFYKKEYTYV